MRVYDGPSASGSRPGGIIFTAVNSFSGSAGEGLSQAWNPCVCWAHCEDSKCDCDVFLSTLNLKETSQGSSLQWREIAKHLEVCSSAVDAMDKLNPPIFRHLVSASLWSSLKASVERGTPGCDPFDLWTKIDEGDVLILGTASLSSVTPGGLWLWFNEASSCPTEVLMKPSENSLFLCTQQHPCDMTSQALLKT